jgi:hypothetical protein
MKGREAPLRTVSIVPPQALPASPSAPGAPPKRGWGWTLLVADAHAGALAVLAAIPLLAGIWALLSPGRVLSREMTWDFLFILLGAWHLHFGHVAHVDFHEPLAVLNFLLPLAGFHVFGVTPLAFMAGVVIVAMAVFVLAFWAAWRRLPLLPACIFVVFVDFLILMPTTVGDTLGAFSFAMSYNRYGWSALCILTLILYLPPRASRSGDWLDAVAVAFLLVAMFYLKITYFVAGLGALGLAVLVCPHIRSRWVIWVSTGALVVANALAPYSHAYLVDIWDAVQAGGVRSNPRFFLWTYLPGAAQYAPYGAAFVLAWLMWSRDRAPLRLPMAMLVIIAIGLFVFSQNAEPDAVPLGIVMAFLLYDQFRPRLEQRPADMRVALLAALLVFPLFAIAVSSANLAVYNIKARSDHDLLVVDRTQLRGLVVPTGDSSLLTDFSGGPATPDLFHRLRNVKPRDALTPFEYVETILEAAALFEGRRRPSGGILVFDQINPLPFMLGIEPPRGDNLWSSVDRKLRPAAILFAEVDYVLVPKFSTDTAWTDKAMAEYGSYLAARYPYRDETQSWILLSRRVPVPSTRQ